MSKKQKTTQQSTDKVDPWAPAIPYLTEAMGTAKGLFDKNRSLSPDQQGAVDRGATIASTRLDNPAYAGIDTAASGMLGGQYAANINPVAGSQPGAPVRPQASFGGGGGGGLFGRMGGGGDTFVPPSHGGPNGFREGVNGLFAKLAGGNAGRSPAGPSGMPQIGVAPQVGPAPQIGAPQTMVSAAVNPTAARSAMGAVDPTQALVKSLSGQVDNPQLSAMADAATRQGQRNYSDAVSDSADSLTRSVLPSIRSGAISSGGYGGSRQGIAEGLALAEREKTLGRGARDLGIAGTDASAGLFGNAYEAAQNRMASTADSLDARALQAAEANAARQQQTGMFNIGNGLDASKFDITNALDTRRFDVGNQYDAAKFDVGNQLDTRRFDVSNDLEAQKFNAGQGLDYARLNTDTGFRNNEQAMAGADQRAQQATQGAGLFGMGAGLQDANIKQLLDMYGYGANWEQDQFAPYAGILGAFGGMGRQGTSSGSSTTRSSDPMGTLSNLAMAAATAYAGSDARIKRDVVTDHIAPDGVRWVHFNYLWDEPDAAPRYGVIAQEAREIYPDAVSTHPMGFLVVDYSKIGGADGSV